MKTDKQINNYNEFITLIDVMSLSWSKKTGISYEEIKSTANLVFCDCMRRFRPKRGNFENYFRSTIRKVFREVHQKDTTIKEFEMPLESFIAVSDLPLPDHEFIFNETIRNFSANAQMVIEAILQNDKKIDQLSKIAGKTTRGVIRSFLREDFKWSHKKIDKIFDEIEEGLWDI